MSSLPVMTMVSAVVVFYFGEFQTHRIYGAGMANLGKKRAFQNGTPGRFCDFGMSRCASTSSYSLHLYCSINCRNGTIQQCIDEGSTSNCTGRRSLPMKFIFILIVVPKQHLKQAVKKLLELLLSIVG